MIYWNTSRIALIFFIIKKTPESILSCWWNCSVTLVQMQFMFLLWIRFTSIQNKFNLSEDVFILIFFLFFVFDWVVFLFFHCCYHYTSSFKFTFFFFFIGLCLLSQRSSGEVGEGQEVSFTIKTAKKNTTKNNK